MSNLSVDDLLAQATCAIWINGKSVGTAWLVSDKGELLTAGHVLCKDTACREVYDKVEVRFSNDFPRQAYKIQLAFHEEIGIDFAILKLVSIPSDRQPLPISLERSVRGKFRLYGYGEVLQDPASGVGEFAGVVNRQNTSSYRLFRLTCQELTDIGFNGGAVYSENLGAVVGIQIGAGWTRSGPTSRTVLAMPLYRLTSLWEPLNHLAAQQTSQQQPYEEKLKPEPSEPKNRSSSSSGPTLASYDQALEQLLAYWQGAGPTEPSIGSTCRQLANQVFRHLPVRLADLARQNPSDYVAEIRQTLIDLEQRDPIARRLIHKLTKNEQRSSKSASQGASQVISVTGNNQRFNIAGGDQFISAPIGWPKSN